MKSTTLAVAAISLLQLTAAQPHRRRHAHPQAHQVVKKDGDVVVTIVDTVYAEATDSPLVIVYVDQDGKPVSTTTEGLAAVPFSTAVQVPSTNAPPAATPTPESSTSVAPAVESVAPVPEVQAAAASSPSVEVPAPVATPVVTYSANPAPTSTTAASIPSYSSAPAGNGFGIVYSPYNADGTCKSQSQVETDFKSISTEYKLIRTYGTDCKQVANVLSVVKSRNIKLFAGIFDISDLSSQVATIVSAANGNWSNFDTISVGNELVNSGSASAETVVAAIGTVRGLLKTAGYTGNVVTVDTLVAARANPSLCDASDYCAVNCHPFFDGNVAAADSGSFLTTQIPTLQAKLANKSQKVVITEVGWPTKGNTNGAAVPSLSNQAEALSSIKTTFSSNPESIILFTAFNDMWKKNTPSQFEAEQFWGMGGLNPPSG